MKKRIRKSKPAQVGKKLDDDVLKTRRYVRVSHHKHTGKYLPSRYTSYAIIFFILIFTCLAVLFVRQKVVEAGPPQTASGNIQIGGIVLGPPPTTPANITEPTDENHVTEPVLVVKGTCQPGLFIEIYRNDAFAGLTTCSAGGNFQITITLLAGKNKLVARTSDSSSQYGPDSSLINVYYDVPTAATLADRNENLSQAQSEKLEKAIIGSPLLIYSKPVHAGFITGANAKLSYQVNNGEPAYAISIDWGDDSQNSLLSHPKSGKYEAVHKYVVAGQYEVTIHATDSLGQQAVIQVLLIINGNKAQLAAGNVCTINSTAPTCPIQNQLLNKLDVVWPAIVGASFMAGSFWLGERVVYARLSSKMPKRT